MVVERKAEVCSQSCTFFDSTYNAQGPVRRRSQLCASWSKMDFKGLMRHEIKIAEALQPVDNGKPRSEGAPNGPRGTVNNETNQTLKKRNMNEQTNKTNRIINYTCMHHARARDCGNTFAISQHNR